MAIVYIYIAVVTDAPAGRVTLGASVANGIEQKDIDSLQQCLKKCIAAGGGIQATVSATWTFGEKCKTKGGKPVRSEYIISVSREPVTRI